VKVYIDDRFISQMGVVLCDIIYFVFLYHLNLDVKIILLS